MSLYKRIKLMWMLLWIIVVVVACGGEDAPTPTPIVLVDSGTSAATNNQPTALPPTPTLAPVITDAPTLAPTLPPPVVEEEPAAPTTQAVESTLEPTAEPISDAIYLSESADFLPQNRNPLTGEITPIENLNRRPILCKISDSPPEWVRPQSGLNSADIIFEHLTEGDITRFSALFYGETPATVGPVRSARLIDLELPLMYDAALCFSGGSSGVGPNRGVYQLVFDKEFAPRILRTDYPGYYRTGENKPFEHTFYNRLSDAWGKLDELGQNVAPTFASNMVFSSETPANSADANTIIIQYGSRTTVEWRYDAEIGKYRRWADGAPVIDAIDNEQVTASNVIVVKAPHIVNYNICETQTETECIAFSTEIQIWGGGFVSIFRDGRQINGSWQRPDRNQNGMMFTFFDEAGNPLPLQLGNSWIQVAPYEYIETTIEVQP